MFNQLLESKAKKEKMAGGTVFSIVLHTVLIAGAVYATAKAGTKDEKAKAEKIQFVEMKKEAPKVPDKPPPPKEVVVKPPPPKGFQVLRAPVKIDIKIPEIDLSKAVTNESDFTGKGVKGGTGSGVDPGGDAEVGIDERLGVDLAIDRCGVQFAEGTDLDVGRRQQRLAGIQAGAGDVVVTDFG